jgi:hypothetical protein
VLEKEGAMVSVMSLWLPIVVSAVLVFVVSTVIHMVLGYHKSDIRALPAQDEIQESLRRFSLLPGDYVLPKATSMKEMGSPEFVGKLKKGPVILMTVLENRPIHMGGALFQWFLYSVLVSVFAGYLAGSAVGAGAPYLSVFRFAGTTAFVGYSLALMQSSIWAGRAWRTTIVGMFDGLLYGLVTGGAFGWLWPR